MNKEKSKGASTATTRVIQWSKLHPSLLQQIVRRIPLEDRGRFRSTCRSWRTIEKNTPPPPQLPWILLKPKQGEEIMAFRIHLDGQMHPIKLPQLRGRDECKGSCKGWFLIQDVNSSACLLLNPVNRKRIPIPIPLEETHNNFLVTDPDFPGYVIVVSLQGSCIWIFQPAVDIGEWRQMRLPAAFVGFGGFSHIIACNGKLYLWAEWERNTLVVVDPHEYGGEPSWLELDGCLVGLDGCGEGKGRGRGSGRAFIVESSGEILLVVHSDYQRRRYLDRMGCVHSRILGCFQVFKADLDAMAWVKVESLNNRALFLSKNSYFSISAAESGIKGDRIFCILPGLGDLIHDWFEFDIEHGIPIPTSVQDHQRHGLNPWMWFMPTLG